MADGLGYGEGCGPGGLEIKAAGNAIDIEDLSREVNAGEVFAFKGIGVDSGEVDTTTGDELVLEGGTAGYLVVVVAEDVYQAVQLFLVQVLPTVLGALFECLLQEVAPEARGEVERTDAGELLLGMMTDDLLQRLKDLRVFLAEPVDGQRHLVLVVVKFTGRIAGELEDGRTTHTPVGDE